ncbi:unnamed protein product [Gulo gulo]|uniref:Uncharacterized protein n=1 Tax=Gulo gulo TaxID=48420 RepID=A0A9X9LNT8_GULGU|nr:unnamed protein product [Gulo gulo]
MTLGCQKMPCGKFLILLKYSRHNLYSLPESPTRKSNFL